MASLDDPDWGEFQKSSSAPGSPGSEVAKGPSLMDRMASAKDNLRSKLASGVSAAAASTLGWSSRVILIILTNVLVRNCICADLKGMWYGT